MGYLKQERKKAWRAQWNVRLTTGAALVSAAAAVAAVWIAVSTSNSLDQTNAQVEALTKRLRALELHQHH